MKEKSQFLNRGGQIFVQCDCKTLDCEQLLLQTNVVYCQQSGDFN
jgi:hypothetical protein